METRIATFVAVAALVTGTPAGAANREHQVMMAEIRMLQEQTQQLQLLIGTLADSVKQVTSKLDDQSTLSRKAFADQKVLVDNVAEGVRVLREKVDETNVRISSLTQEMEGLRIAIPTQPAPGAAPPPEGVATQGQPPAPVPSAAGASPQEIYRAAYADYTAGQWDLAITGFQAYIKSFPKLQDADDAQLYIGESHFAAGRFKEAAAAYNDVITTYPGTNAVPQAMYKLGLAYDRLGLPDRARQTLEAVVKSFPDSVESTLAKQALDRLAKPKQ
ncbi:MAG: tol-pal system protein YbgF [Vicinamibacterales bacterium]